MKRSWFLFVLVAMHQSMPIADKFFSLVCFEYILMIDKMVDDDAEGIENE